MTIGIVIFLAVLQGLTEFLPVSSSGHLRLFHALFGQTESSTVFDLMLHVGTLVPIVIIYRDLLIKMLIGLSKVAKCPNSFGHEPYARVALLLVLGSVPTAAIGLGLGHFMEGLTMDLGWLGVAFGVNGCVLLLMGRAEASSEPEQGRGLEELRVRDAILVGTIQGFAIFRGISRSGSTITAGLLCGLRREAAAAFSFLLSIPAILGGLILELKLDALDGSQWSVHVLGGVVAGLTGAAALVGLLRLLRYGRLHHFAWYCFALAALTVYWRVGA
jgi:undecaprenyl-diphosphatase